MAEVSNGTLAVLVVIALLAVLGGTLVNINGITGFAITDTGYVNLTISSTLAIQVDTTNRTINFGACSGYGSSYWCVTNDTQICNVNGYANCSGDTATPQFIRLDNVGNVDANITMASECNADTFIGGTSPGFSFITTSCNGTGVDQFTSFSTSSQNVCTNLSYLGGMLRLYANVTIPGNAVGGSGGCLNQNDVVFSATQSP